MKIYSSWGGKAAETGAWKAGAIVRGPATSLVQSPLRVLEKSSLQLPPLASCFYRENPKQLEALLQELTRQLVVLLFSSYAHLVPADVAAVFLLFVKLPLLTLFGPLSQPLLEYPYLPSQNTSRYLPCFEATMAPKSPSKGKFVDSAPVSGNTHSKTHKKPTDYSSHGVTDNDIFLLPGSDFQIMVGLTVLALAVRVFRIYQPSSVVFDEVQ